MTSIGTGGVIPCPGPQMSAAPTTPAASAVRSEKTSPFQGCGKRPANRGRSKRQTSAMTTCVGIAAIHRRATQLP
jgi:hypothetical protein